MSDKERLLIIDDDEDICEMLEAFLEDDYQCETSFDGASGLQKALESDFDIIITDLEMPNISGVHLINEVRKVNQDVIIIVSTGHSQDHAKVQVAIGAGANGALTKPFSDPSKFSKLIEEIRGSEEVSK